ncbi:hypothetical protein SAMN05444280_15011 [Tangfeifania diversioriginum]|uniref:Xaa-Pro dipeptidyl-peptidase-like domain-containing protein n=1 Tax=Tangfeifania diversioriginum TaxID=1168035 RepID=A0A1M6P120_9BACT|nr:alpha/beta hydrolase [Tangfeifania diversioriginum]SHK01687.1 hypothetical protein SAMN05444280_15011 [Tangfeifania diversioriginum]
MMKQTHVILLLLFISNWAISQNYMGSWKGETMVADSTIVVKFNVMLQEDSTVKAMMLNPVFDKFTGVNYCCDTLHLISEKFGYEYKAVPTLDLNKLTGQFKMGTTVFPLDVSRGDPIFRPQTPQKPYPYLSEEVVIENKTDSVTLSATLTIPHSQGTVPAVILISGSSPATRDTESFHHKSFLVLADYLTRKGIAVLRYDSRGVGKSTGNFYSSTPLNFAQDIEAGIKFLGSRKKINKNQIGLIGHSAGGVVASITASQNPEVAFIVLLASPGINLKDDFILQKELLYQNGDTSHEEYLLNKNFQETAYRLIENNIDTASAKDSLQQFKKQYLERWNEDGWNHFLPPEYFFIKMVRDYLSAYNRFNWRCNPADYLEKVTCPVLSLNGSKDIQVPSEINQQAIEKALIKAGNQHFEIEEMEGLNHQFQECITCSFMESADLEQTFSPKALSKISAWISSVIQK